MSVIRVDNFGPSAGGTTYSARGIAKAWVNFNGTGTIAARDSENVSSLTDNGTGDYTVNIGNDMADANYAPLVTSEGNENNPQSSDSGVKYLGRSSSSIRVNTYFSPDNNAYRDVLGVFVTTFGDLA